MSPEPARQCCCMLLRCSSIPSCNRLISSHKLVDNNCGHLPALKADSWRFKLGLLLRARGHKLALLMANCASVGREYSLEMQHCLRTTISCRTFKQYVKTICTHTPALEQARRQHSKSNQYNIMAIWQTSS